MAKKNKNTVLSLRARRKILSSAYNGDVHSENIRGICRAMKNEEERYIQYRTRQNLTKKKIVACNGLAMTDLQKADVKEFFRARMHRSIGIIDEPVDINNLRDIMTGCRDRVKANKLWYHTVFKKFHRDVVSRSGFIVCKYRDRIEHNVGDVAVITWLVTGVYPYYNTEYEKIAAVFPVDGKSVLHYDSVNKGREHAVEKVSQMAATYIRRRLFK